MRTPANFGRAGGWPRPARDLFTGADWLDGAQLDQCRHNSHYIAELQNKIATQDRQRADAQAFLDMASNRSTRDQSQILEWPHPAQGCSWTRVFEDLEQVMPPNLHVVSLRPHFNEQNEMQLYMLVAGDSRAAAVETGAPHGGFQTLSGRATRTGNRCRRQWYGSQRDHFFDLHFRRSDQERQVTRCPTSGKPDAN